MLRRRPYWLLGALALASLAAPREAGAIWPPTIEMTQDDLSRRENWPNDPGYGGQWESWSWVPAMNLMVPGFRVEEARLGAGNNVDRAWAVTTGDPRVLLAVLDSGINWDNTDLINKVALNTGELPMPMGATTHDANGDGVVNVADYANDPRIPCGTGAMRNPRRCRGAGDMPNDPNGNGVLDAGDLIRVFSDGTDADSNGYADDIAGWDFFQDDNDPADATRFGHGTGEARWSAAEANNGEGDAGDCPRCQFVPVRVGDSFITDVNDFAQGTVYAVDRGASVVQEALGTLDMSTYAQRAIDYAYSRNVVVVASAADENSRHHNMPGTANHTLYVHAIRHDNANPQSSTTYLNFNNCTNYGAQLALSVAGSGCSSEATGHTSGIAGLIYSAALQRSLAPPLSAEEVRQLLMHTADDVNVPESVPGHPMYDPTKYPSVPGWDQRFGYGRTNARRAVDWVREGKIPPEVDIVSPAWFTVFDPTRDGQRVLRLEGTIAARRAPSFDYTIEWAPGVEPTTTEWRMVRAERNVTAAVTDRLGEIDLQSLQINNPGEVENRYTITVRVRATAHYAGAVGDVPGEVRRAFYVHRDPTVLPGFPIDTRGSLESSPRLADLDRDGSREIIQATADGEVHAYRANGTELAGFPVHTNPDLGMSPRHTPSYTNARAYSGESPPIDPGRVYETVLASPGVADLDGDNDLEIVVASYHGTVYVWNHDGTPYGHGFPYTLPRITSDMTSPSRILDRGIFGSPVLHDLDGDRRLEITFGAFDGKLYSLDSNTAMVRAGFPVEVHFPEMGAEYNRVFGSVGVGNFDADGRPDLVVVSNERLPGDPNTGAIYVVHGDGNMHAGGAFHPNWPIAFTSFNFFPLVGEGLSSSPAIADLDGDGRDELALTGTGLPTIVLARGAQPAHPPRPAANTLAAQAIIRSADRGRLSTSTATTVSFVNAFSVGSFGDLDNNGTPDYVISGAELNLAINLAGGGRARKFEHLIGAWDGRTGRVFPGFPQVIEDYTFFHNPSIADLNNDGYPEMLVGTGGYYLRAFDACGREPAQWPKFTGQWIIASVGLGDIDGDHAVEAVAGTRSGKLWAWRTATDDRTSSIQWPTFRHDNANTGNYGTALDQGVRRVSNLAPIECPLPGAGADAGVDAGAAQPGVGGGCSCSAAPAPTPRWLAPCALAALALAVRRRRRHI